MIGVYSHNEAIIPGIDYSLFYTLNLPIKPFIEGIDVQKDIIDKIEWHRPYRQWIVPTNDLISKDYQYFIKNLGLKLMDGVLLFGLQQNHAGYRHRDVHPYKHWHWDHSYNSAAINYLISPSIGSLDFWDLHQGGDMIETESSTPYESGVEHSHSKIITSWTGQDNLAPVLIRTEAVHQATNYNGTGPRVTLTLRFELNPIWWMARIAFMPYVIKGY